MEGEFWSHKNQSPATLRQLPRNELPTELDTQSEISQFHCREVADVID